MNRSVLKQVADTTVSISSAQDKDALLLAVQAGFSLLGFSSFNLGCHKTDKYELALNPTLTSWSDAFMMEYSRQNWADCDPNLARSSVADRPLSWSIQDRYGDPLQQSYIDFLHSSPLRGGLLIPLTHRPGTISSISVESHQQNSFEGWTVHAVTVIANAAMMKAEMLGLCPALSEDESHQLRKLSGKQTEILKWASEGKSNADIAVIVGLSERVVKYHMSETLRKLGVATRAQAVSLFTEGTLRAAVQNSTTTTA